MTDCLDLVDIIKSDSLIDWWIGWFINSLIKWL